MQVESIPTKNRNIVLLSLNYKDSSANAPITSHTEFLKTDYGLLPQNLFQDSANHRSGWSPDASRLLMFLNNITVPYLLGDALFSVSVAKNGLSLIVLFFEKIADS